MTLRSNSPLGPSHVTGLWGSRPTPPGKVQRLLSEARDQCDVSKAAPWEARNAAGDLSPVRRTLRFMVGVPLAVWQLAALTEAFLRGFRGPHASSVWGGFGRLGKQDRKLSPGSHSRARLVLDPLSPQGAEGQVVGMSVLQCICPSPCDTLFTAPPPGDLIDLRKGAWRQLLSREVAVVTTHRVPWGQTAGRCGRG